METVGINWAFLVIKQEMPSFQMERWNESLTSVVFSVMCKVYIYTVVTYIYRFYDVMTGVSCS